MLIFVVKIISDHFHFWLLLNLQLMILGEKNQGVSEEERMVDQGQKKELVSSTFKMTLK